MSQEFTLHRNGKGKIYGYEAHVSADSYLDERSSVHGKSLIHRSTVINSHLYDSRASSAIIQKSGLRDVQAIECRIEYCDLINVDVLSLHNVRPILQGVWLRGVIVEGDCHLSGGWALEGIARIHDGTWERAPRHIEIIGNDIHTGITECTNGRAHLACSCKPLSWWLKRREHLKTRLLKRGWLTEQAEKVLLTFEEWSDIKLEAA